MDETARERSDRAFYEYEARKVLDYLKEKGIKKIESNTREAALIALNPHDSLPIDDPELVFAFEKFMRENKTAADTLINDYNDPGFFIH